MTLEGYETWETRSGEKIQLKDMTKEHLENCVGFVMSRLTFFNISQDDEPKWFNREYEDIPEPEEPVGIQWYLHHGWNYIRAFTEELDERQLCGGV